MIVSNIKKLVYYYIDFNKIDDIDFAIQELLEKDHKDPKDYKLISVDRNQGNDTKTCGVWLAEIVK